MNPHSLHETVLRARICLLLVVVLGFWAGCLPGVTAQKNFDVVLDAKVTQGKIPNLLGVTCGPIGPTTGWFDLTAEYRWLKIPSVRIHDCSEVGDIHNVFPNYSANPSDPKNYSFKDIDPLVERIVNDGMNPLYRLGYSWSANGKTPPNYDHFAEICKHIALHFTQGWANGYKFKNIEWEVWNEPNLKQSWSHSSKNFYEFYTKVAKAIRSADPSARVGTCALAVNWPRDYQEDLIAYCEKNKVPLDFYSWHYYGWGFDQPEPYDFARQGRWVRSLLDMYGLHDVENYQTEWNVWHPGGDPRLRNLAGAAYCLSAVMFMVDGGIDMAYHYRGDVCDVDCGGLFIILPNQDSVPNLRAWAFYALSLMQDTPIRVQTTGSDRSGFAVLSGVSGDGKTYQTLVSDFWSKRPDRRVLFKNLPPARRLLQVYTVDEAGYHLSQLAILEPGAPVEHRLPKKAPWIQLIKLDEMGAGTVTLVTESRSTYTGKPKGTFRILATKHPLKQYFVLGSASGSKPGSRYGDLILPINIDLFTLWLLGKYGKSGYDKLSGVLDNFGGATIPWQMDALDPVVKGTKITFGVVLLGISGIEGLSNPVDILLN